MNRLHISSHELNINILKFYLNKKIQQLSGLWIKKNSGYEKEACVNLGFTCDKKRYWDAVFNEKYIEIKKGKSIWLNEVRYCELYMNDLIDNIDAKQETITIFMIPNKAKNKIEKIYIIDTKKIIKFLKITPHWAKILLSRKNIINRSLNCQQSMTLKDLDKIADYIILNI